MPRPVFVLLALMCAYRADARHVYPFAYQGVMPSMVRMVDDPRQVGTEDEIVVPPRYTSRILKTHDFYPQDDAASRFPNRGGFLPPPQALPPFQNPNVFQDPRVFQNPGVFQNPVLPEQVPVFPAVEPEVDVNPYGPCRSIGANRNEGLDQWCEVNCHHNPRFCPSNLCQCDGQDKKKK